jgi:hypothetical protein
MSAGLLTRRNIALALAVDCARAALDLGWSRAVASAGPASSVRPI